MNLTSKILPLGGHCTHPLYQMPGYILHIEQGVERLASRGATFSATRLIYEVTADYRRNETIFASGVTHGILTVRCGLALLPTPCAREIK